jgi:hypothetical protein
MRNFDKIYERVAWGHEGNGSGTGSMMHTTENVRSLFEDLIENHGVRRIVDVSVGGMLWWPTVLEKHPEVEFYGYDISLLKIKENKEKFSDKPNWHFYFSDVTTRKEYPESDLLICRHTLNHLSSVDVIKAIKNLKNAKTKILALTQHPIDELNKEELIIADEPGCINYRPINLMIPPISMEEPWMEIDDADAEDVQIEWKRKFSLWKRS